MRSLEHLILGFERLSRNLALSQVVDCRSSSYGLFSDKHSYGLRMYSQILQHWLCAAEFFSSSLKKNWNFANWKHTLEPADAVAVLISFKRRGSWKTPLGISYYSTAVLKWNCQRPVAPYHGGNKTSLLRDKKYILLFNLRVLVALDWDYPFRDLVLYN